MYLNKETPFKSFTEKQLETIKTDFIEYIKFKISLEKETTSLCLENEVVFFISFKAESYNVDLNPYSFVNYKETLVNFAQVCFQKKFVNNSSYVYELQ